MNFTQPPYIKKGDKIAISAPASKLASKSIEIALEIIKNDWQLEVVVGNTVGAEFNDFAETDQNRTKEFQKFLDDPSIKLILCARGGYGCSKIIDGLDFSNFKNSPKWICGFSDITALILQVQATGFQAIHGVMAKTMVYNQASNESLKNLLFGGKLSYEIESDPENIFGKGTGEAIGGNLSLLVHCIGSKSDISYDNKILFLEDVSEYKYNIDRMMVQLKRASKLKNLKGLVIGDFSDIKENDEPFGKTTKEIILDHVAEYNYPVAFGFEFGHENRNLAIRMGEMLTLEVNKEKIILSSVV
jgi:muramoyltetrapeptide carboxypeptidase